MSVNKLKIMLDSNTALQHNIIKKLLVTIELSLNQIVPYTISKYFSILLIQPHGKGGGGCALNRRA